MSTPSDSCVSTGRGRRNQRVLGVTLVELILSIGVMVVLLGGISSAILIASHALPDGDSLDAPLSAADAAEMICSDLHTAIGFTITSATAVTFTVPNRSGGSVPDTIRYAWSGVAGDPVTRSYNGSTPAPVAADVYEFSLSYRQKTISTAVPPVEGAEVLLSSYTGTVGLGELRLNSSNAAGEFIGPVMPAGAASWRITRALVYLKEGGAADEDTLVQVRTANPDLTPTGTTLEEQTVSEALLGKNFIWIPVAFSGGHTVDAADGACLVLVKAPGGGTSAKVGVDSGGGTAYSVSGDQGVTWGIQGGETLLHSVYGKITTASPDVLTNLVTAVDLKLRVGSDGRFVVDTAVPVLNTPEDAP